MINTSPSEIAVRASGLKAAGVIKAKVAGQCAMCGFSHEKDALIVPFAPGDSFTDFTVLNARHSKVICGWCAQTWKQPDFTQKYTKAVFTKDGVYPAASNAHIAYWLLNPPKGQHWLWTRGDQKRMHIVWRAGVNYSDQVFQIRAGEVNLTIRSHHLRLALESAKDLARMISANRKGPPFKSPFISLDRDIADMAFSALRTDVLKLAQNDATAADHVAILNACTAGEFWGLSALLYASPEKPEPFPALQ